MRSPGGRRHAADTATVAGTGRDGGGGGARCVEDHQYLLGEQPEPGAARWRGTQRVVITNAGFLRQIQDCGWSHLNR